MRFSPLFTALVCAVALPARVAPQTVPGDSSGAGTPHRLCFRGQALPRCEGFLITELVAARRINRHPSRSTAAGDDEPYFTWEGGGMVNLTARTALGGSIRYGTLGFDSGDRWGVQVRYRRWTGSGGTFDVAAGLLLEGHSDAVVNRYPGYTAQIALGSGDLLGLTAGVEMLRFTCESSLECAKRRGTDVAWYGGIKLGSYPGVIAGLVLPVLVSFAVASLH